MRGAYLGATTAPLDRLRDYRHLLCFCPGDWLRPEEVHEDERGLFPLGAIDSRVDYWPSISLGKSRRSGSYWYGRQRGQVWNFHFSFLLGWGNSGHDLCRDLHDAVLLWFAREICS